MVTQIHFLVKQGAKQCADREFLLADGLALDEGNLLHFIGRNVPDLPKFLFRLGDLPNPDDRTGLFNFFFKIQCHKKRTCHLAEGIRQANFKYVG